MLIGSGGELKLADFGYAVQLESENEKRTTVCGSPFWMVKPTHNITSIPHCYFFLGTRNYSRKTIWKRSGHLVTRNNVD